MHWRSSNWLRDLFKREPKSSQFPVNQVKTLAYDFSLLVFWNGYTA